MALTKQTVIIPLAAGLQTKDDPRAMKPPGMAQLQNAVFDETGGWQTRKPYDTITSPVATLRKFARYNDELLTFASTELYSYSSATAEHVSRGTYLAPKVTEASAFINPSEQTYADRAELNGVVVYVWTQASTSATVAMVAARDKATGAVLLSPTSLGANTNIARVVALTTRILLFAKTGANALGVKAIDVTSAATLASSSAAAFTSVDAANFGGAYYDVCADSSTTCFVAWTRSTTTSYGYAQVNQTPTVTASTKGRDSVAAIGVAKAPTAFVAVIRAETTIEVRGDILTSAFVDSSVDVVLDATATSARTIACAFRSVADSGEYRCYAFISSLDGSGAPVVRSNYINTAGTAGTAGDFALPDYENGSRAFDHGGKVYFWASFDGSASGTSVQLQNTYFLFRDDGTLVAKAAGAAAGQGSGYVGHLPGVQTIASNQYAFCGLERRVVPLEITSGVVGGTYSDRGPRDIILTLDSNEARRWAQLGKTLYIAGGQVMQYDGTALSELGWHLYPYKLAVTDGGAGNIADGSYTWLATYRADNAAGERDRSTTATLVTAAMAGGNSDAAVTVYPTRATSRTNVAVEVWRTAVSPVDGSPAYLVTSEDPTATGDNGYFSNNLTGTVISFNDNYADATLIAKQTFPENGPVLESIAPPACTIIAASEDRLFLAGISYDPNLIWYSKLRGEGEVAAFNDALTIKVPTAGGAITALALLNETLIVFCETAMFALPGEGFDNTGGGQNYGPSRQLSLDIGAVSQEAVAVTPEGILFKSAKGWFQLDRGFGVSYVGAPIADFDSDTITRVTVMEEQHQIRVASTSRILLFDMVAKQWSEWTSSALVAVDAIVYGGDYHWLASGAVWKEVEFDTTDDEPSYGLDAITAWISMAPWQRIYELTIFGEYRSAHDLRIRLYADGNDTTAFQDKTWTVSPTTVGGPLEVTHRPSIQKLKSLKVRITPQAVGTSNPPAGAALKLTHLELVVGVKGGVRRLPAAQRQ